MCQGSSSLRPGTWRHRSFRSRARLRALQDTSSNGRERGGRGEREGGREGERERERGGRGVKKEEVFCLLLEVCGMLLPPPTMTDHPQGILIRFHVCRKIQNGEILIHRSTRNWILSFYKSRFTIIMKVMNEQTLLVVQHTVGYIRKQG